MVFFIRAIRRPTIPSSFARSVGLSGLGSLGLSGVAGGGGAGTTPGLAGWLRTPQNTGIAAKGLTSADLTSFGSITGDLTITTPQTRKIFNMGFSQLIMTGPGAILNECMVISSHQAHGMIQLSGAGGQQITYTDVICSMGGAAPGELIAIKTWAEAKNTLFHSVRITGATIAIWHDTDQQNANSSVISEIYAYDFLPEAGNQQHKDGFTRRNGVSPLLLKDSWFRMSEVGVGSFVTAAFFIQATNGVTVPVGRVDAQRNYFSGDGYNSFIQASDSITVNDCRFKTTEFAYAGGDGVRTNQVWTNNFLYTNTPGNDYRGTQVF